MAHIGSFTKTDTGYTGQIRTLALDAELILVPAETGDAENAPDYRIHLGDGAGPEIGAAWRRTGEKAGEYLALQIDDPTLMQPIRANLFLADEKLGHWTLIWNRPPKRDGKN